MYIKKIFMSTRQIERDLNFKFGTNYRKKDVRNLRAKSNIRIVNLKDHNWSKGIESCHSNQNAIEVGRAKPREPRVGIGAGIIGVPPLTNFDFFPPLHLSNLRSSGGILLFLFFWFPCFLLALHPGRNSFENS